MDAQFLAQAIVLHADWIVGAIVIGFSAVLVADYLHTLPDEVAYMWPAAMSPTKTLFFFVRYYVFVHNAIAVTFFHYGKANVGGKLCEDKFKMQIWSSMALYWVCNAILYLRVYAFSGHDKRLRVFLAVWFIGLRAAEATFVQMLCDSMRFMPFPEPIRIGCTAIAGKAHLMTWTFLIVIISLASVTAIMIFIASRRRSLVSGSTVGGATSIFHIFIRDGIVYFVCLSLLSIVNIIVERTAPEKNRYVLNQVHTHADAILTGRMLIYLRASAHRDYESKESGRIRNHPGRTAERSLTGIQFALKTMSSGKDTNYSSEGTASTALASHS